MPGSRSQSFSWIDSSDNLWLFGGQGLDINGTTGNLNDLWECPSLINQWFWISGNNTADSSGNYGFEGDFSSINNFPGSRSQSVSWVDFNGNFWLFGGFGDVNSGDSTEGNLNDLWYYSPSQNQWTWVSGNNSVDVQGIYGIQGISSSNNIPGSRYGSISWVDSLNNLWLFGGSGIDGYGSFGKYYIFIIK